MPGKMKAVMYGAGNIGRGFIGALLSQAGYYVTFIDVNDELVEALNREKSYPLRIISSGDLEDIVIDRVSAINGKDMKAVSEAIAEADIMATAVGANILKFIAGNIAEGLRLRFKLDAAPLNILICENLMDADHILSGMISNCLSEGENRLLGERVGFVETSIGRMVPVQTDSMREGHPLRVCVERYGFLPVDKDAFKGEIPEIERLVPYSPFRYFLKRKLYIHNMGHSVCAYIGLYTGEQYIFEAIGDPYIQLIVKNAMEESMQALSAEFGIPEREILPHIEDLLLRFGNRALGDTCSRVGSDTARKLAASDRLIGAAKSCLTQGIFPTNILVGIAGAIYRYLQEHNIVHSRPAATDVLLSISGLESGDSLIAPVLDIFDLFAAGTSPKRLKSAVDAMKMAQMSLQGIV